MKTFRGDSTQAAVRPETVVKVNPPSNTHTGLRAGLKSVQVHALIFQRAPEAFDEDIVQPAAPAVHGDTDSVLPQNVGKCETSELTALIGVEDIGLTVFRQGLFQGRDAEISVHGVGKSPGQHFFAVPVHNGHQVQKAFAHGDVSDIHAPDQTLNRCTSFCMKPRIYCVSGRKTSIPAQICG